MHGTNDLIVANLNVTEIAETSREPRGNEEEGTIAQWKLTVTPPWQSNYPLMLWLDQGRFEKPNIGRVRALLKVGSLVKPDYDGQREWMYRYYAEEIPYTGEGVAQASQSPGSATQAAPVDYDRRHLEIKWGQAVNLASAANGQSRGEIYEEWLSDLKHMAETFFPVLIEWEKEAVDKYMAQDSAPETSEPETTVPLKDDDGYAKAPEMPDPGNDCWDYKDFRQAIGAASIPSSVIRKALGGNEDDVVSDIVEMWCIENGKTYAEAFERVKEDV